MGFADASVCPSCRGRIEKATTCPHCGLVLTTHEIQQAWQALVVADQWVERARSLQAAGTAPSASAAASPQHPPTASSLPLRKRSVSAGSVLLALGAIAIIVAGIIFISVSWDTLGVLGRALVLLLVTAVFGLIGRWVTRRGLRASAEALWSIFLALLTLDWFAAREEGLAGLDALPFGTSVAVWAVLVVGAALLVVPMGRRHVSKELLAPSIAAGAAAWFAAGSLAAELSEELTGDTEFWPGVLATAVVGAATLVLRQASVRVGMWIGVVGVAVFGLFAVGFAVGEAVDHPSWRELAADAHGLPLLIVAVLAAGCGLVLAQTRVVASAVALASVATLLTLPIEDSWPGRGGFVLVAALVAGAAWVFTAPGDWFRGARLTTALAGVGLALAASPWVARLLATAAEGAVSTRADDLGTLLEPDAPEVGPWWVALIVAAGIGAALVGARRWPEPAAVREHLVPAAWCVAVLGAWSAFATFELAAVAIAGDLLVGGALLTIVLARQHVAWRWVGPVVLAAAPLASISSWPAATIVWPVAGIALAVVALRAREIELRSGAAFMATGWGLGTAAPALEVLDGDHRWTALALVVAGLVGLAVAVLAVRPVVPGLVIQAASAVLGTAGVALGSTTSTLGFASFTWTVAGAGVVVLSLVPPRNTWLRWIGAGLLGVGYVLRLAASDVEVVEAYTLPFAALLLAAGVWAMRDPDGMSSMRALSPGVVLALLPSLPQALDEPTSLRALLLGLGAAASLAVGTWRRWQVPFVAGAVVLAALVVVNVAPVAKELPLVVLLGTLGVLSLGAGFTWEDRVRDGRAVVRYVGSMR